MPEKDRPTSKACSPTLRSQNWCWRTIVISSACLSRRRWDTRTPGAVVIGSDQTATLDGRDTIGKPGTRERAREQLRQASGMVLTFHTALAVVRAGVGFAKVEVIDTTVRFRRLSDAAIERYLTLEPAFDCAGSAKAEGLGIALMSGFESTDPTAIVGLPLIALTRLLDEAGLDVLGDPLE